MNKILEIENFRLSFQGPFGKATAVRGVELAVSPGETLALVGESGCGKTALCLSLIHISKVHGKTMEQIHFHEVGTLDAVADVVGNCILMEKIGADRIIVSPVHVGCGSVKCAHGILPVPAPATALILEGIPIYSGEIKGELCTPTGAALLRYFADSFETMPVMTVRKIGYGMGTKNFEERPNCIRALFGETAECSADMADNDRIDSVSVSYTHLYSLKEIAEECSIQ